MPSDTRPRVTFLADGQAEVPCTDCGVMVRMPAEVLAMFPRQQCQACEDRARGEVAEAKKPEPTKADVLARQWADEDEGICPRVFRDTVLDRLRPVWGAFVLDKVTNWDRKNSQGFVFRAESGKGKTRLMLELFKALHFEGKSVKVLWPEDLQDLAVRAAREGEMGKTIRQLTAPFALGIDDGFLAGATDERTQRFLWALADARYRQCRPLFVTTQVTGNEYKQAANRFADMTPATLKRIDALFRRITATSKLVTPESEQTLEREARHE